MYVIVIHTEDETWDERWNRRDNSIQSAYSQANDQTRMDVYWEGYNEAQLKLAQWDGDKWETVNIQPPYSCCPDIPAKAHAVCDYPDCIDADRFAVHVPHKGSSFCKSGKRPHCTCDSCY